MCQQLLQPLHAMAVQRGDRVEALAQPIGARHRDQHAVAQLILQPLSAALTYLLFRHFVFTPDASPAGDPPRRRP